MAGIARAEPPSAPPQSLSEALGEGGSAAHGFLAILRDRDAPPPAVDLADVAHFLCLLHGRYPGLMDYAATRSADPVVGGWLGQAADAFAGERALLTRLTVAAGPIASTPGEDQCLPTIINLRNALNALSQSDRHGCAIGAAFALAVDWLSIRVTIEMITARLGIEVRDCQLPDSAATLALAERLSADRLTGRAIAFGASQMLLQHRLFWDMLAARRHNRRMLDGLVE